MVERVFCKHQVWGSSPHGGFASGVDGHARDDTTRRMLEYQLKATLRYGKPMGWVGVEAPESLPLSRQGSRYSSPAPQISERMPVNKAIYLRWLDSSCAGEWTYINEDGLDEIETVGFLIFENAAQVQVAHSIDESNKYCGVIAIPKSVIIERKRIKLPK